MKNLLLILAVSFMYTASAHAQGAISMQSTGEGFFLGAHLGAATWTADNIDGEGNDIDGETGGGGGITFGYGFSQLISAYLTADAVSISPDAAPDHILGHGDLGILFTFGSTTSAVRPFLDVALNVRQVNFDLLGSDLTYTGAGVSVGGGVRYHLSLPFAIDAGAKISLGEFTEAESGGASIELEALGLEKISASSVRINVGIVWFPGQ